MSSIRFGRVEGGHDSDPDPEQAGRVRIRDIAHHGPNVNTKDLPFSQLLSNPSDTGPFSFNRPPLPGTMVVYWTPDSAENTGYAFPIGIPHGIDSGGNPIPGNYTIPNLGKAFESLINLPPNIEGILDQNRSGIQKLTKQLQDASQNVKFELLEGIPTNGATFLTSGLRNIPLKNIATALESFDQVLNSSTVSSLGGQSFSLGSLFDQIPMSMINELTKALPQQIGISLNNLISQLPKDSGITIPSIGASSGSQINPGTFFQTALDDLKNVSSFGELSTVLQTLQTSSKSGMDQLGSLTQTLETPFGDLIQIISPLGEIENQISDAFKAAEQLFGQLVSSMPGVKSQTLLTANGTSFSTLISRFPQEIASEMNSKLGNFSPDVNQSFNAMQSWISNVDNGNLSVAGITFGSTIQHK